MWQHIYRDTAGPSFELVSIAVDPTGPDAPRPYLERAGATFPALVDAAGTTSAMFGFKVVPNGLLVDESGVIRWRRDGGFSNVNAADREAVRRFAGGDDPGPSPAPPQVPYALGALERELVATHLKLASVLDKSGRRDEALVHWQAALERDPENLTIRKAIWAARFPERFDPAIDNDWQTQQLKVEREVEIAAGICGPDGCPIPR